VGQPAADVSKAGAKGCADASLQVDVYALDSHGAFWCRCTLSELQGRPRKWEMGCATLGAQAHLVLFHRPTASLASRTPGCHCQSAGLQGGDAGASKKNTAESQLGIGEGTPGRAAKG